MAVRIITDSTSDISKEVAKAEHITVIPLAVQFGEETYLDGVNLTKQEFYTKLTSTEELPSTSQINPEQFEKLFSSVRDEGDEVIGIFLSSEMSGTFRSAEIAAENIGGEVYVVDSKTVTFGLGLMVRIAVALRDSGKTAREIQAELLKIRDRIRLLAVVQTLRYLKKGGRISASTAFIGGVLGICPLISVENGIVNLVGKSKGRKLGYQQLKKLLAEKPADAGYPVVFGHTFHPELIDECKEAVAEDFPQNTFLEDAEIGCVVGTHVGPGCVGFAYVIGE